MRKIKPEFPIPASLYKILEGICVLLGMSVEDYIVFEMKNILRSITLSSISPLVAEADNQLQMLLSEL